MAKSSSTAAAAAKATGTPSDDNVQNLLKQKDEEISSLKKEIETYKKTITWQSKEIKRLSSTEGDSITKQSIQSIANKSLKSESSTPTKAADRWKNRFQELVAYKLEHGDCNVPKSYKDKSLHSWVRTQRESKKDFDKKKPSCSMTQDRVDALNSIDFQWVVGHQPKDAAWETMFQTLLLYKQQHGHTRVSTVENKALYKWVLNQRARRRLLELNGEGKAKGMTWARVEKLSAIDFIWEAIPRRITIGGVEDEEQEQSDAAAVAHYGTGAASPSSPSTRALLTARQGARASPAIYKYEPVASV